MFSSNNAELSISVYEYTGASGNSHPYTILVSDKKNRKCDG